MTEQDGKGWLFFIIASPGRAGQTDRQADKQTDILLAAQAADNRYLFNNSVGELPKPTQQSTAALSGFFLFLFFLFFKNR